MKGWMNEWMIKPWDKKIRFEIRTKHCINDLTAKIFKQSDRLADRQLDITNQIFLPSPPTPPHVVRTERSGMNLTTSGRINPPTHPPTLLIGNDRLLIITSPQFYAPSPLNSRYNPFLYSNSPLFIQRGKHFQIISVNVYF